MNTASNALRNDLIGEIAYLMNHSQSGSIVSDIGTFTTITITQHGIHQEITIGEGERLINPSLHLVLNRTLLALGYRLTH
jgi:hypothetical protein